MKANFSGIDAIGAEATVSSKGQVTLPKQLRTRLGIDTGTRIRFSLSPQGGLRAERVLYELEDLWQAADCDEKTGKGRAPMSLDPMSLEEMNEAKARRKWRRL